MITIDIFVAINHIKYFTMVYISIDNYILVKVTKAQEKAPLINILL